MLELFVGHHTLYIDRRILATVWNAVVTKLHRPQLGLSRIVPPPLPPRARGSHIFSPEVPRSTRLKEALASHRFFSRVYVACHQYDIQALQTRPLHLYVESRGFSAQECARYQKYVIPL